MDRIFANNNYDHAAPLATYLHNNYDYAAPLANWPNNSCSFLLRKVFVDMKAIIISCRHQILNCYRFGALPA